VGTPKGRAPPLKEKIWQGKRCDGGLSRQGKGQKESLRFRRQRRGEVTDRQRGNIRRQEVGCCPYCRLGKNRVFQQKEKRGGGARKNPHLESVCLGKGREKNKSAERGLSTGREEEKGE